MHHSYITSQSGRTEAIIVPKEEWDRMVRDLALTKKKLEILNGIEHGMKEVALYRQGKRKLKTLDQVLNGV